ncbi:alpha/beta fold hydrolase [Salarchaeum sp. JOR-1]|uniref:alpha/beta fold hydrolase n=1 Tax=Salarchaeum sp. JOR-1 TaxID=2599399 RepID=UPI001198BD54|nr:alpha/beta hydrolase [Salarchaeum sp. JOR-1]QDX40901.1 alpha/beta hydrolase [Salarchaeum sp. JOR-1]
MPTVRTNGVETYYESRGEGPVVVFLHGAFSDHRVWAERTRSLADEYRVVVYDLRGHGRTGGSDRDAYSIDTYADDLRALVDALSLDAPVVCGLSMGGMVAQRYAATSSRLSGVVSIAALSSNALSPGEWVERRAAVPGALVLASVLGFDAVEPFVSWLSNRGDDFDPGDLDEKARIETAHANDYPSVPPREAAKIRRALLSWGTLDTDYASIDVPALAMCGGNETARMTAHARYLASEIPDADYREIPDAGHNAHVDNPEFVRDALTDFLRETT